VPNTVKALAAEAKAARPLGRGRALDSTRTQRTSILTEPAG